MQQILAELRLVFHVMADPQRFHEPYIERNAEVLRLLEAGDVPAAVKALARYLDDAEEQLIASMRAWRSPRGTRRRWRLPAPGGRDRGRRFSHGKGSLRDTTDQGRRVMTSAHFATRDSWGLATSLRSPQP
jgi:hypothetical protein